MNTDQFATDLKEIKILDEKRKNLEAMTASMLAKNEDDITLYEVNQLETEITDLKQKSERAGKIVFNALVYLVFAAMSWAAEAAVILTALNQQIGILALGQATFLIWLISTIILIFTVTRRPSAEDIDKKERVFSKAFKKILGFAPAMYALYIILIQIGLF